MDSTSLQSSSSTPRINLMWLAGDFISRLRCSLDHLAWQLALLTSDKPSRRICFPVYEENTLDTQVGIVRATYGIPDEAISVMRALQPYHAGDRYRFTHLWRLNTLWNIDKHRHIAPHAVVSDWLFRTDGPMEIQTEMLNNCGKVKVPIALKDKVQLNPSAGITFRFQDKAEGIDIGIQDFFDMHQFVADTVFPAFARFFK